MATRSSITARLLPSLTLAALAMARWLPACGPYPPVSVRFDADLERLAVMEDPFDDGSSELAGYLARFQPAVEDAARASLARPERRILLPELDAARALEEAGDVGAARQKYQEIAERARRAYREHRPSGDVITYAIGIAQDRLDLYERDPKALSPAATAAYLAARNLFDAGDLAAAAAAVDDLQAMAEAKGLRDQADYLKAAIALRQGRPEVARPLLAQLAQGKVPSPKTAAALYTLARLDREADPARAAKLLAELLERFPRSPIADDALGELALLDRTRGDTASAVLRYVRIRSDYPEGDMGERARESLLGLGPEIAALRKVPDEIEPAVLFSRAFTGEELELIPGGDALAGQIAALEVAASGTFLPGEARYRIGALHYQAGNLPAADASFAAAALDPDPSLRARALFMKGVASGDGAALRRVIDEHPMHSTADDALFLLGGVGPEGVGLLRRIVKEYPHRDRIASAARAVIVAAGGTAAEDVASILREAGHEDRLLYAEGVGVSYLPLMTRYPESPLALLGFFKQAYLTARGRQNLMAAASPDHVAWARKVSPYHDPSLDEMPDEALATAEDRQSRAASLEEARTLGKFARAYLGRAPGGTAARLVEAKLPMALFLEGRPADALGRATEVVGRDPGDPAVDEAGLVQILALRDLGRPEEAMAAARAFPSRWPRSPFASAAREHLALMLEDAGRRVEALSEYLDMGYEADARYFIDVLLTGDELRQYLADHPDDPRREMVRHALGVRGFREGDLTAARAEMAVSAGVVPEGAEAAVVPEPISGDQGDGGDDEESPEDPEGPVSFPPVAAPTPEQIATEARRKIEILDALGAAPASDPAGSYAVAAALYKDHRAFYCEPLWQEARVETLKFLRMRSEDEAKRFMTYLLQHNVKLVSRARFREVHENHQESSEAPRALYMEGLCDLYVSSYSSLDRDWFGRFVEDAPRAFLALADRYPEDTLADDALYWVSRLSADPEVAAAARARLIERYPDGDAIQKLAAESMPPVVSE